MAGSRARPLRSNHEQCQVLELWKGWTPCERLLQQPERKRQRQRQSLRQRQRTMHRKKRQRQGQRRTKTKAKKAKAKADFKETVGIAAPFWTQRDQVHIQCDGSSGIRRDYARSARSLAGRLRLYRRRMGHGSGCRLEPRCPDARVAIAEFCVEVQFQRTGG